jgi:hypothetical protein
MKVIHCGNCTHLFARAGAYASLCGLCFTARASKRRALLRVAELTAIYFFTNYLSVSLVIGEFLVAQFVAPWNWLQLTVGLPR